MSRVLATIRLLVASIRSGLYAVFLIYIVYLLTGYAVNISNIIAGFLIVYAIYTFDRARGGEEDSINRSELEDARKNIAYSLCLLSAFIGTLIFF